MNRTVVMTLGFLLVFFGIQLNVVDSYVLTPRMANFLSDKLPNRPAIQNPLGPSPQQQGQFAQVGYNNFEPTATAAFPRSGGISQIIRPPEWLGWPIMFLGAVFFLNGLAIRR